MNILVTGAAGFIGFHLCQRLALRGDNVVSIDNLNDYYTPSLKYARLRQLGIHEADTIQARMAQSSSLPSLSFQRLDITDKPALDRLFATHHFNVVVNLAAQAGVRYSLENPYAYIQSNVLGFLNILECSRSNAVDHLVYASSSSVYGGNTKVPFAESDPVDSPVSIYAATKKADELMASVYSHLYGLTTTGLRFFTVYGPWGRPDMAPILFAKAIRAGKPIRVFNHGNLSRDFTFIDDITEGLLRVIDSPTTTPAKASVYNIGHGSPVPLMDFIHTLEQALGQKAQMQMLPMQPGDVPTTFADTSLLASRFAYQPSTTLPDGIAAFVAWFNSFYPT